MPQNLPLLEVNVLTITNILPLIGKISVISELLKGDHLSSQGVSTGQNLKAVYGPYGEN